mmetsp:Transcript_20982/g.65886  ORF Transcript_20982/g.65886 Transcript_20982/m.65886 type:complete len:217 (-) Transcript_20982:1663-2313(-)
MSLKVSGVFKLSCVLASVHLFRCSASESVRRFSKRASDSLMLTPCASATNGTSAFGSSADCVVGLNRMYDTSSSHAGSVFPVISRLEAAHFLSQLVVACFSCCADPVPSSLRYWQLCLIDEGDLTRTRCVTGCMPRWLAKPHEERAYALACRRADVSSSDEPGEGRGIQQLPRNRPSVSVSDSPTSRQAQVSIASLARQGHVNLFTVSDNTGVLAV